MKRISIVGLCLMAVMAVSATTVVSASAAQPKFEAASFPVNFTSESVLPLEPLLSSIVGGKTINVLCQMSSSTGEIASGGINLEKISVLYTGCKLDGESQECHTLPQAAGMITTKEISGTTGEVSTGSTAGILLKPTSGSTFAEFNCGLLIGKVTVSNAVIGEAVPFKGSPSTMGDLIFEPNATNTGQGLSRIVGGPLCELIVDGTGRGWIMDHQLQVFSVAVTLK